ncbi:PREDICTED: uncharacterized protein LOC106111910 isoform X2 [Papilio polytes]|uniref:Cuticular protein n=1 Tax=Papilio polytes TaxID=76194 RepID=I4DMI8_PAPPL|nr:uncharacterized protein LOC106111910 precursor [Papilio polytes]BAM19128.1 unknown secreted protein [Papilio polytes]
MYKLVLICALCLVIIEARPRWQFLPPVPGYVPVYIRSGDTPLEEINPELAEAFHALPAGRSAGKLVDAAPEIPEANQSQPDLVLEPEENYEKKFLEKKKKATEVVKPIERR